VGVPLIFGGLLSLAGCSNEYPADLHYPPRADALVQEVPKLKELSQLDRPGDLPEWMASLEKEGATVYNPANLNPEQARQLEQALDKLFGKPAEPKVDGIEDDVRRELRLDKTTLAEGSQLFRQHCLHCHGLTGNGQGPTAAWVNPHPRDYRRGIFKFTSSSQETGVRKPRREDLIRTISQGIEGTSMPAFGAQTNSQFGVRSLEEIDKLVSYVIHLSLRGQVEFETMREILSQQSKDKPGQKIELDQPIPAFTEERVQTLTTYWLDAEKYAIAPQDAKELTSEELKRSIARGYNLFIKPGPASCISCHKDFGRQNNFLFDDWGTIVRPLDLTLGVYRGGRRPIDLYWRLHSGINGANMPAFKDSLKPGETWDVINLVRALPYPGMLPGEVRDQVYSLQHNPVAER
jgi:mono/diheme cytochrome c family protein